jgi:hypothetical protein
MPGKSIQSITTKLLQRYERYCARLVDSLFEAVVIDKTVIHLTGWVLWLCDVAGEKNYRSRFLFVQ